MAFVELSRLILWWYSLSYLIFCLAAESYPNVKQLKKSLNTTLKETGNPKWNTFF